MFIDSKDTSRILERVSYVAVMTRVRIRRINAKNVRTYRRTSQNRHIIGPLVKDWFVVVDIENYYEYRGVAALRRVRFQAGADLKVNVEPA